MDMVTMVGNESRIEDLVTNLIYLEHDAIAAYDSCTERLDDEALSAQIANFRRDHDEHLRVLKEMARRIGIEAPAEGDMKQMLTTGKIVLADLMGDGAILKAMTTNEDDTVTAYERASRHPDAIPESKAFFMKAHQDEERHRAWMESTARSL
jgi:rubrerythrin